MAKCPICQTAPEVDFGNLVPVEPIASADPSFVTLEESMGVACDGVLPGRCDYALVLSKGSGLWEPRRAEPDPARPGQIRIRES